jgi:hypothetical protein
MNRQRFNFHEMGIRTGRTLRFVKDSNVTVTVASTITVWLEGEEMSLAQATRRVLRKDPKYQLRGLLYWTYKSRRLRDIYNETYLSLGG